MYTSTFWRTARPTEKGTWVRDGLDQAVRRAEPGSLVIVDSVRIEAQVEAIRAGYGQQVVHVHLRAEVAELARRYRQRKESRLKELVSYAAVRRNKTEKRIDELGKIADIVVHTIAALLRMCWSELQARSAFMAANTSD